MPKSTTRQPSRRPPARRTNILPWAIGAVVVLAAISIGVGVASRSGDGGGTEVAQTREVSVTGTDLPQFQSTTSDPAVGRTIPEVSGEGFDGQPVHIRPGEPQIVMFLAHWCPHCRAEVPRIVEWSSDGSPEGVRLVGVSTGVDEARPNYPPSAWLEREDWSIPTIADDGSGTAAAAFGLTGYPYFVAVKADGTVAARASGELDEAQLEALARAARG